MSKNVMILFSGGLDSTYLMWKNLKKGNVIQPIYLEITNNENKVLVEKQQITLIVDELKKEFDKDINVDFPIIFEVIGINCNVSFSQPLIWSLSMAFAIKKNTDEIQIGYVVGDDALGSLTNIKKLFNSTKPFTYRHIPLKFPLIKKTKHMLMDELPEQYHKLITSCENPKLEKFGIKYKGSSYRFFEPCCDCVPCEKIISHNYFGSKNIRKKYEYPVYKKRKQEIEDYEIKHGLKEKENKNELNIQPIENEADKRTSN